MSEVAQTTRSFLRNRSLMLVYGVFVAICVVAIIYFALRIQPSDIQVSTHYTSFGGVNFYTNYWWAAFSFVAFFLLIAVLHTGVGIKLFTRKGVAMSAMFGCFSVGIATAAIIGIMQIINIAFPL